MKTNVATKIVPVFTHEGGRGRLGTPVKELERAVASCMLWENTFYEKGSDIAARIASLSRAVKPKELADLALRARVDYKLRHVPLFLTIQLADVVRGTTGAWIAAETIGEVIKRPDEIAEFVAIYWKNGKRPLTKQMKLGLGRAFNKFNRYQFAKWNKLDRAVKLRDVLFLTHPKFETTLQQEIANQIVNNSLPIPDTWETELSAGKDKRATWERLLSEGKLADMATLMNLRNMVQAGVSRSLVVERLGKIGKDTWALPFRFISAAKHAPEFSQELSDAMLRAIKGSLDGYTQVVIDVSGSMTHPISAKSQLVYWEAAAALGVLFRELCKNTTVWTFDDSIRQLSNYRGLPLIDGVRKQVGGGTQLRKCLRDLKTKDGNADRVIVITDEQSYDGIEPAWAEKSYLVNVAANKVGLDTKGGWTRFNGWSDRIADFISYEETGKILGAEEED